MVPRGCVERPNRIGKHSFGQWPGVRGQRAEAVVGEGRYGNAVHRTGESMGERLLRELQRKVRDECLNGEIFYSLKEAQIVIEKWRVEYNTRRPHSALGYRPPAPAACSPWGVNSTSLPMAVV